MSYWRDKAMQGRAAGATLHEVKAVADRELDEYGGMYRSRAIGEMERGYRSKRNSFLASVVEGAGTGIGLGLAGAAALPLVKRVFPGIVKGKVNPKPEAMLERSSDGYTAYTRGVRGGRKHISSSAYLGRVISAAGAKGYVFDERHVGFGVSLPEFVKATTMTTYDTGTGEERSVRVYVKGDSESNPVTRGRMAERYPGYVSIGTTPTREPGDYTQGLSHQLYLAGVKFAYQGRGGDRATVFVHPDQVGLAKSVYDQVTGRRSNPAPAADALYESFHGTPATGYEELIDERHYHGHLAELGTLVSIKVMPQYGNRKGRMLELDFAKAGGILVCSNETGTQLYLRGGNQEISPKALGFTGHQATKDLMDLGVLHEITYRTKKGFDNFKTIDYYHSLGEVSGNTQPTLLYDTMNHELQIAGGSYEVLPAGITD